MEVVGVEFSHGDKFALPGNHMSIISRCLVVDLLVLPVLNGGVPPKLASWKEKDIMQCRIEWVHFRNVLERALLVIQDDVMCILRLVPISRQNDSNLI